MKGNESPKGQNERKWRPKRPKWKEMKAQKAKMKGNEGSKGQNERKWRPKRPKWKEMKAQKAKMKGNKGAKGQNERKSKPKIPKWKEMKGQEANMKKMPFCPGGGAGTSRDTRPRDTPGHGHGAHPGTPRDTHPGHPGTTCIHEGRGGPGTWSGTRALKEDKNTKPIGKGPVVRRCVGGATEPRFCDCGRPGLGRVGRKILGFPASRFTSNRV